MRFPKDVEEVYFQPGGILDRAAGSAQLDAFGAKILAGDYAPGFFLKHFVKDMKLAEAEAENSGLHLEILGKALENYQALEAAGFGDLGTHALMKHYEQQKDG